MSESMTADEFTKGFVSLCAFLLKFSAENYGKLYTQTIAKSLPNAVGASTLSAMLKSASKHQKILVSNLNIILFEFVIFFSEHFLSSNKIKAKIHIVPITNFVKEMISNKLNNIDSSTSYILDDEDKIVLELILEKLENYDSSTDIASLSELSDLKRKVAEFERIQSLNNNDSNSRANRLQNLSEDFENSKSLLLSEIENKLLCNNHISNFAIHLSNNTVPSSLFYNRFPSPMFDHDKDFVDKFNEIIHESQIKFINLCSSHCEAKMAKHSENIDRIINKYKDNYEMDNIYKELENRVNDNLKDKFTKSATKISSYVPRGYIAKSSSSTPGSSPPRKKLQYSNSSTNNNNFQSVNRSNFNNTPSIRRNSNHNENNSFNNNNSRAGISNNSNNFQPSNNGYYNNNNSIHNNRNNKRQRHRSRSFHNKNNSNYIRDRPNNNFQDNVNSNGQVFEARNHSNQNF